jgi:hypothetical protein
MSLQKFKLPRLIEKHEAVPKAEEVVKEVVKRVKKLSKKK